MNKLKLMRMIFFTKISNVLNSLWHSDAVCHHKTWSTLVQLNTVWCQAITWTNAGLLLIVPQGRNLSGILNQNWTFLRENDQLENVNCKMTAILPLSQCFIRFQWKAPQTLRVDLALSKEKQNKIVIMGQELLYASFAAMTLLKIILTWMKMYEFH